MTAHRALLLAAALAVAVSAPAAQSAYESAFRFIGSYPANASPGYQDDMQGVTTDGASWFLTQAGDKFDPDDPENSLWKFPVSVDLDSVSAPGGSVERVVIGDTPLGDLGFVHFGDLSWYRSPGGGEYLIIPVEGPATGCSDVIAIFDATTLGYLGHFPVCDYQNHVPWAAVDSAGYIYSSNYKDVPGGANPTVQIEKYSVVWSALDSAPAALFWGHEGSIPLVDDDGSTLDDLWGVQGGVITPSDELLYLSVWGPIDGCDEQNGGGIWVFDKTSAGPWRRIERSVNGPGVFKYEFDPCEFGGAEEPEGLTWWDFDDGSAPGVAGQLHAILLDNIEPADDDWTFFHYTNKVFVPGQASTVVGGLGYAWDGALLRISSGSYPQPFLTDKRVRLEAKTAPVILGQ